jgi:Bacterial archaeo-eukaryotic release factor family 10
MLTHTQLVALHRSLRDERVLSVYIDGTATDPATQRSWRMQLNHGLTDLRTWLEGSSHNEREEFEKCVRVLDATLERFPVSIGAPGWAAFITKEGVRDAQQLPAPVPTLAVWSTGACLAPYMRVLKQSRPVFVVITDATKAGLYRYHVGKLTHVETIRAHHVVEPALHMGGPPRQGFHTGTRGSAGRDSAQRSLLSGRDRMLAETVARIGALAREDEWILVGGIKRVAAHLAQDFASVAPNRVLELPSLDVHLSEAEIARAAAAGASALRDAFDARRVAEISEKAGAHGLGVIGATDTEAALGQASVRELYITHRYLEDHGADAEAAVRAALDQDASVEEVSGQAAEQLDSLGGMAASLRFRPSPIESVIETAGTV